MYYVLLFFFFITSLFIKIAWYAPFELTMTVFVCIYAPVTLFLAMTCLYLNVRKTRLTWYALEGDISTIVRCPAYFSLEAVEQTLELIDEYRIKELPKLNTMFTRLTHRREIIEQINWSEKALRTILRKKQNF